MNTNTVSQSVLKELESEAVASRKCLERIPGELFSWKPHEKSMPMGYLALIVAEVPKWLSTIIEVGEIDFATFKHFEAKNATDLVRHFDENMAHTREVLSKVTDAELDGPFLIKNNGQILVTGTKVGNLGPGINHLVHHRGQLTVYMRLNNIPVPSIYGPSADDKSF